MTDFKNIRTGVIGVGSMGKNHARIYSEISNLVAVSDPNEEVGGKVAKNHGVNWYSNYKDICDHVDAVSIAVPTIYHKEVAEYCASRGIHILVEKPLAQSSDAASMIISSAKKAGIKLAVGHVERHNPVVLSVAEFIKTNDCGELLTLCARRYSNYPQRITDVGVLFDLSIHDVDVICSLVQSTPKFVFAVGGKAKNNEHEDFVNLLINFENGIIGICQTNWLTPMKVRDLSITTTKQLINVDYLGKKVKVFNSEYKNLDESNLYKTVVDVNSQNLIVKEIEPLRKEIEIFLGSISEDKVPSVSGEDGLRAVKIVEAGLSSLQSGKIINL